DLHYAVLPDGLKETLAIRNANAPSHYRFVMTAGSGPRLHAERQRGGAWAIFDAARPEPLFFVEAPTAVDSPPTPSLGHDEGPAKRSDFRSPSEGQVTTTVRKVGGHFVVDVAVDPHWLHSPGRAFPVLVDPTITVQGTSQFGNFDWTCSTCVPTTDDRVFIGTTDTKIYRSALQFGLGSVPAGAAITDAQLRLYYDGMCLTVGTNPCQARTQQFDALRITQPWSINSTTGSLQFNSTPVASVNFSTIADADVQWLSWNLTQTVKDWFSGLTPNNGVLMKLNNETLGASGIRPPSGRFAEATLKPKLDITYTGDAVSLLPIVANHADGAELQWTKYVGESGASFDRYELHRSTTPKFTPTSSTLLATIRDVNVTRYRDTTAAPSKTFYYKIVANTSASNEQSTTTPGDGKATRTIQSTDPASLDGESTTITNAPGSATQCANLGADRNLRLEASPTATRRALLYFDLRDVPTDATVNAARLSLWRPYANGFGATVDLHRVTRAWEEGTGLGSCTGDGATWSESQGGVGWSAAGGDYDPTPDRSLTTSTAAAFDNYYIEPLVSEWVSGTSPNLGVLLKLHDETPVANHQFDYYSDDFSVAPSLRPKLYLNYSDGSHAVAPTVSVATPSATDEVGGTAYSLTAAASDDRRVDKVEFLVDGAVVATDTTAPFGASWNSSTATNSTHTFSARATDDAGNVTTSAAVSADVDNSAAPTTSITSPSAAYRGVVLADGPNGYWRLGETSGTTAADASGNARTGTLGGTYLLAQTGMLTNDADKSILFKNATTDGSVSFTNSTTWLSGSVLTAEAWVKYTTISTAGACDRVLSRGWGTTNSGRWFLGLCKSSGGVQQAQFGLNSTIAAATVTPGTLHLVGTYDGATIRLYVNGAQVASAAASGTLYVGAGPSIAQTLNDDVTIDEAAVYAKALSAGQIKAHYDAGLGNGPTVGGTINVTASAADDRAVTHVEFYVDSDRFADLTNSPYTAPLDTTNLALPVYNGTHTLTTKAYDIGGHVTTSAPVAVTASNAAFGSKHSATITAATAVPAAVTYDPAASVQDKYGVNVTVKNTSAVSWLTSDVVLRYRWISPDTSGNVVYTDGADVPLPANLTAGGSVTLSGLLVSPPTLPDGVNRGQYTLRFDLFDKAPGGGWFADKGNPPLDNPVTVNKALVRDALGLERYYHYVGQNVGAGMQQLTNIANGNSILRWTPFDEPGVGLASVLDLTYNALEKKCDCPAGNNWSLALSSLSRFGNPIDIHPNNADTIAGRSNKFVELTDGDGTTHRFTDSNNDGYWEAPAGVHLYLRATGSTDPNKYWALTRPDRVTFYYDHDGYPQSVVDGNNNTLTFTESSVAPADDPGGPRLKVTKVVDAKNRSFTVTYYTKADAKRPQIRGRVKQITDHVGRTLLFDYYLDGNLLRITQKGGVNPDGTTLPDRSFVFTYTTSDGSGPAISSATARANPDAGTANESTRLYSVRDPRGHETTFSYLGPGYGTDRWKLASITDRAQKTTTFAYDTTNRVTTVTAPLARKSTYSYDAEGKVTAITNPLGQQTTVAWGGDRAVSKVTEPTGVFTTFTYNDNGYLTSTTDQLGHMTQLAYDNSALDGNDVSTKWESGRTIPHISDLASKTDPKGVETTTILNDYQWTFAHDTKGNITGITDPLGKTTTNVFNGDGTLASTTDARGDKTTFPTYDANGLATTIVDPLGNAPGGVAAEHQTTFGYDAAGDLLSVQDALHQKYGATSRTNASYFDYDPFGRMVRQSAPKSTELLPGKLIWSGATFDPNDNLATQTYPHYGTIDDNAGGDQTTFGYDDMDRLTSQVVPHDPTNTDPAQKTHTTTYAYDDAGRLITQTDPQGVLTAKTDKDYATFLDYDPLDRITTQTRYRVDDLGTVVETQKVHACYDLAGDLRSVTAPKGDAAFPGCPNATTTNYTPLAGNYTTSYAFYADHKLKKTTDPLGRSQSLTYDSNGDADSFTDENGTTSTRGYDQKRQLVLEKQPFRSGTSAKNLFTIYRYDAVGNLSALVSPRAYDASTDPTKQTNPLGVNYTSYVTSYDYDATDRLTRELLPTGGSDTQQLYVHHAYDPLGRQSWASLSTDQAAAGSVVDSERSQFTYFDTGWVHTSKDPAEPLVTFDYTAKGEQSERTRAQGTNDPTPNNTERWSYFADGDLQQEIDPHGSPTTYSYDANDNPTDIDDTGGVQTPDETELVVQQSYDGFDRLIKTRQQKLNKPWHVSTYGYDLNNNVSTSEDDAIESPATPGRVTDYAYDQADQVLTQTDHGLQTGCGDDQLIQYTYEQTRDLRDELVSRASASCTDQSPGWTVKEQTSNTYFLDGS
ncbi:MAG: DNRLRE domain-containing protein, partial [Gaiellaceae bacterium]